MRAACRIVLALCLLGLGQVGTWSSSMALRRPGCQLHACWAQVKLPPLQPASLLSWLHISVAQACSAQPCVVQSRHHSTRSFSLLPLGANQCVLPLGQDTYAGSGRKKHPAASAQPAKPAPHPNPSMPHPDAALARADRYKQAKQPPARCRLCRLQQTQPSCLGTAPWPSGPTLTGELHQRHTRYGPPVTLSQ